MDDVVTLIAQLMFPFIIAKADLFHFKPPDYLYSPAPPFHSKLSLDLCHSSCCLAQSDFRQRGTEELSWFP